MTIGHAAFATVAIAVGLQFAAGFGALRLIPLSGKKLAWTLIALALFGMGARRSISLVRLALGEAATPLDFEYELLGLAVSVLMFAGVRGIGPIFSELVALTGKLKRSEARHRAFVENTLEGIIVFNAETGAILDTNPHFRTITGYSSEELAKMSVYDFSRGGDESMRENIAQILGAGKKAFGERRYTKKGGGELVADVAAVALDGEEGPVILTVVHDVTERKREAESRERMIAELEESAAKVRTLSGLLPICATCKKIRDDAGYWTQIENYLHKHAAVEFTHGICPTCVAKALEELEGEGGAG